MLEDEKLCQIALSAVPGVGARTLDRLVREFGSAGNVFSASREELVALPRITDQMVGEIRAIEHRLDQLQADLSALADEDVDVFVREEASYPRNLKWAADSPPVLYVRGRFSSADDFALAIVGSRDASEEGMKVARRLAEAAVDQGITVVSGLALGIDGSAHSGALDAGGRSIGVLGSGIRVVYPSENYEVAESMMNRGAVVSELAPNTRPSGPNLMARDRIISGLSLGVIVVEAGENSGSVDTANKACKQQRPIWAVDWQDDSLPHAGNRGLLREGALPLQLEATADIAALATVLLETERSLREASEEPPSPAADHQLSLFDS
ncbi:MAG: DNA protecting protein DprA [Armatimonadetes bacterium CG2_30_59_28]|nr:DNA-protecting protein DprA [Armatimonadota bacterium]OIO90792.1 MAG: DNA protecting protein DprA [Armatimonadetes bacterium CG2_30_59_28]PIU67527.1 MAG: DNA-protecting protein DprA [Armatimonadetes bacterium CG07_land_8_20_14_0_80_59_28]PIX45120.1 MAG: DNA-protecting protein DprA [Armatimonadetes bacterium CG_4_8_14_3_um_filter_58_9]PIY40227.1 MAG: DNA-protecting protein DprA [Armatimonadetes bacterium CG_4_10_14_3_um_filter_59_10]